MGAYINVVQKRQVETRLNVARTGGKYVENISVRYPSATRLSLCEL